MGLVSLNQSSIALTVTLKVNIFAALITLWLPHDCVFLIFGQVFVRPTIASVLSCGSNMCTGSICVDGIDHVIPGPCHRVTMFYKRWYGIAWNCQKELVIWALKPVSWLFREPAANAVARWASDACAFESRSREVIHPGSFVVREIESNMAAAAWKRPLKLFIVSTSGLLEFSKLLKSRISSLTTESASIW